MTNLANPAAVVRRAEAGLRGRAPARLQIEPVYLRGLDGLGAGEEILILTWLHEARREDGTPVIGIKPVLPDAGGW